MHEFRGFPKIPRWSNTSLTVTEKIDGTNAAIYFDDRGWNSIECQSRKRIITPGKSTDNAGFAGWAYEHAPELFELLGPGLHYGEWYGQSIQRNYGLDHKRFALFNTPRWVNLSQEKLAKGVSASLHNVHAVPVLYHGPLDTRQLEDAIASHVENGSTAVPGWMDVEGVMAYLSNVGYLKIPFDDGRPKGLQIAGKPQFGLTEEQRIMLAQVAA